MENEEKNWFGKMTVVERILAGALVIAFLFIFYIALDANKYEAQVLVIDGDGRVGVNPTTVRLDFGDLSPGTSAVRRVDVENGTGIPIFVWVVRFGSINDLMKVDKASFVLAPKTAEQIEFTTYMPASAPIGEKLTGKIFIFKVPGPWR